MEVGGSAVRYSRCLAMDVQEATQFLSVVLNCGACAAGSRFVCVGGECITSRLVSCSWSGAQGAVAAMLLLHRFGSGVFLAWPELFGPALHL